MEGVTFTRDFVSKVRFCFIWESENGNISSPYGPCWVTWRLLGTAKYGCGNGASFSLRALLEEPGGRAF
jgi:hypothetical protein